MRRLRALAACLLAWPVGTAPAADLRSPPGASSCAGCHAEGAAMGALDGRPEAEIAAALAEYRSGARPASVMGRIAKGFSEDESRAIAAYLSRRGPP
ncbi:c-type cytochrome [Methylobacterium sp. J-068]|uniref:c-type cytochrome n=1 Tax=Methylobacterium sp. J-068 TaxID=2836649 RepID=UPI001FBAC35B|nr:cytochrome C [Methylobacterium sp. J-068]MCJ2036166.1 cytochrome C [Methylobacterium sp. J-068]